MVRLRGCIILRLSTEKRGQTKMADPTRYSPLFLCSVFYLSSLDLEAGSGAVLNSLNFFK